MFVMISKQLNGANLEASAYLRDSIKNLRGPRTVKELSELDQLIRRNLGLNAKTAGGSGKLQIDISILNNAKADRGDGSVKVNKNNIIDVEPNDDKP